MEWRLAIKSSLFRYICTVNAAYMFIVAIFLLSLFVIWTDWVAYRRYVARAGAVCLRWGVVALIVSANLLPYVAMAMMWLSNMQSMVPMMWLLTIYTLLSLSRL